MNKQCPSCGGDCGHTKAKGCGQNKIVQLGSNQGSLSQTLMDELRALIVDSKYDHMMVSTLIGVLEMLKYEVMERNK